MSLVGGRLLPLNSQQSEKDVLCKLGDRCRTAPRETFDAVVHTLVSTDTIV